AAAACRRPVGLFLLATAVGCSTRSAASLARRQSALAVARRTALVSLVSVGACRSATPDWAAPLAALAEWLVWASAAPAASAPDWAAPLAALAEWLVWASAARAAARAAQVSLQRPSCAQTAAA